MSVGFQTETEIYAQSSPEYKFPSDFVSLNTAASIVKFRRVLLNFVFLLIFLSNVFKQRFFLTFCFKGKEQGMGLPFSSV